MQTQIRTERENQLRDGERFKTSMDPMWGWGGDGVGMGGNQCFPASIQQKFMKADWDQSAGSAVSHHKIIQLTPIRPRDQEVRDERAGSGPQKRYK